MKTIETKVYTFDELNDSAKQVARSWFRQGRFDDNQWAEFIYDDAKAIAELMGITIAERPTRLCGGGTGKQLCIWWSGFSCQGDGACFEGTWHACEVKAGQVNEYAPKDETLHKIASEFERIAIAFPTASFTVKHSGHYSHKYCTDFSFQADEEPAFDEQAEKDLTEASRDFMQWIYDTLQKEYEYQNSDEQVDESILANEYTFTEDGNRFG